MSDIDLLNSGDKNLDTLCSGINGEVEQNFIVTDIAVREEGEKNKCFFCDREVGTPHAPYCPTIRDVLRISLSGDITISFPASFSKDDITSLASDLYSDAINLLSKEWEVNDDIDSFNNYSDCTSWKVDNSPYLDELFQL